MSNWFQDHPTTTIISHTILVAATTWTVSYFVLDENKVNLYKAKADNAATMAKQYQAKVSILEVELNDLRVENQKYLSWLTQEPKSIPALEKKIKALETKLAANPSKESNQSSLDELLNHVGKTPYQYSSPFQKGEAFVDPRTKATIGISAIYPDYTAAGVLSLPGNKSIDLNHVKPGAAWDFESNGTKYKMTLEGVNWLNNSLKASVVELDGHKKSSINMQQ